MLGTYLVKLMVYDKANNIGEKEVPVDIDDTVPGWTLFLIAVFALMIAKLTGTLIYSTRLRNEGKQFYSKAGSRIESRATKTIVRLATILAALSYGFWIATEILVSHNSLNADLMTSLTNYFGFAFAILLFLLFEAWRRRQRINFTEA